MLATAGEVYRPAFAKGLMPDPDYMISEWADKHRIIPAGTSSLPGRWRNSVAPYLNEIMDCMSPAHPTLRVTVLKSAQSGGTEVATNVAAFVADVAPGPMLIVHPTLEAAANWDREKLTPNIEANPRLRGKIVENKGRQGGSTTKHKKFPGGFLALAGANSAAGLRQRSIRWLIKDDWDEWPFDVNGQGDPDKMANARQISFLNSGTAKCLEISTPTNQSTSRAHKAYYEESDQRIWKMKCPSCGELQEFRFFPVAKEPFKGGLKFNREPPYNAHYVCEFNGCIIEHHEKPKLLASGAWHAQAPGPGRHPGFKISSIFSPFVPWDEMAKNFLEAKDKPLELKTFYNLWLGEAWAERGDAPDWKRLLGLREDYPAGRIPLGALVITAAVDVQKDGFYYEVLGWGVGKSTWVIDKGFLQGNTDRAETWKQLDDLYNRHYENAWGQAFWPDMFAVDAGYNTHMVHAWVRNKERAMAVRGVSGPQAPVLGTPTKLDISYTGQKKLKGGLRVWPVGDWQAKLEIYGYLRLEGVKEGQEKDPWGYCHFHMGCDENYFKQLTAESLVTVSRGGKSVEEWQQTGENHFLDCRKYNHAAAERLGISRFTIGDWEKLAGMRNVPVETLQGDLLALASRLKMSATPAAPDAGDVAEDQQTPAAEPAPRPEPPRPSSPPKAARSRIAARMKL